MSLPDDPDQLSQAESAELLRIVLPRMRANADGYSPASYAIWYEYVRGGIPRLKQDIDAILAKRERLSAAETRAIHDRHLRDRSEQAFAAARTKLATMLTRMRATIAQAAESSGEFDALIEEFGEALVHADPSATVANSMAQVVAGTSQFRESMQAVNAELDHNKAEVDRLTAELSRLREDVLTDPLTGLMNRRGFDATLEDLKRRVEEGEEPFSIVMIDIDHFKKINDTHGHLVGDRVLQRVGATMRSCVRGSDFCARYGGEEFALLLPGTATAGARTVVDHMRNALRRAQVPGLKPGVTVSQVTVSAGVTAFTRGDAVEDCIRRADTSLYASKNAGRDRVTVHD